MGNLDSIYENRIADKVYRVYEKRAQEQRGYLGGSIIGDSCERKLWYGFRWFKKPTFSGRILRLFETGHQQEDRLVQNLIDSGLTVHPVNPDTGEQWHYELFNGHYQGNFDGVVQMDKLWYLLEIKTHSEKSYKDLVKKKVEKAKPLHYAQMQSYMGMGEIDQGLYLAINKNTEEIYEEIIPFNKPYYEALVRKASRIVFASTPPPRISETPAWFECKFCDFSDICHEGDAHESNYRNDGTHYPHKDGTWKEV